jgi:DNA-binding NarL/FixJ family response regulator
VAVKANVVIIDKNDSFRAALKILLEADPRAGSITLLNPDQIKAIPEDTDVILADFGRNFKVEEDSGKIKRIQQKHPGTFIVWWIINLDSPRLEMMEESGVDFACEKALQPEELDRVLNEAFSTAVGV